MAKVLQSPSHFSSPSRPPIPRAVTAAPKSNDGSRPHPHAHRGRTLISAEVYEEEEDKEIVTRTRDKVQGGDQLSPLALLVTIVSKSWTSCNKDTEEHEQEEGPDLPNMEIGLPTDVRHVAHVTFDRFNGFLGLPVEFEPEVPRRPPSASTRVFGVSTESMQLSFDSRGNSVPTILLLMQHRLYAHGGLQAEGIFRINPENSQEESVRDQLNRGVVPDGVDVHCLAGLIKAWFRELPTGVLDTLSPERVMQSQSEEECARLMRLLPPTEASLLDWAINLMADVAQLENVNKMNARNIAMVFAPNMTHMSDPLTALMYAVQVMNFLKTLIVRTLREREDSLIEPAPSPSWEPSDDNGHQSCSHSFLERDEEVKEGTNNEHAFVAEGPALESSSPRHTPKFESMSEENNLAARKKEHSFGGNCPGDVPTPLDSSKAAIGDIDFVGLNQGIRQHIRNRAGGGQCSYLNLRKGQKKGTERSPASPATATATARAMGSREKTRGSSIVSRINSSRVERIEAWR